MGNANIAAAAGISDIKGKAFYLGNYSVATIGLLFSSLPGKCIVRSSVWALHLVIVRWAYSTQSRKAVHTVRKLYLEGARNPNSAALGECGM